YTEQNRLSRVVCEQNVVITKGPGMRATSEYAVYDVPRSQVVLTESPELLDQGNALPADKVTLFPDEDRSLAEGNVRVKVIKEEENAVPTFLQPTPTEGAS
ncbi:MAG: hypothetical protein KDD44_10015, partial [Bdellovibrionales bacterium]|nr:hypothetical protein [Bdellovibrionales bacterium]